MKPISPLRPTKNIESPLLEKANLWKANELSKEKKLHQSITTSFAELDKALPGHGWPSSALIEFFVFSAGSGELKLLVPLLSLLTQKEERWITWINPPFIPYAPSLNALGINTSKFLLIHPKNQDEALWALEQSAKSGACSMILAWINENKLSFKATQRIHRASKQGETLTCLFRSLSASEQPSTAELRIQISKPEINQLCLDIKKRRQGWPLSNILINLPDEFSSQAVQQQLALWRTFREHLDHPIKGNNKKLPKLDRAVYKSHTNNTAAH